MTRSLGWGLLLSTGGIGGLLSNCPSLHHWVIWVGIILAGGGRLSGY